MKAQKLILLFLLFYNNFITANTDTLYIQSKILKEKRAILVSLPNGYDVNNKSITYPLILTTDGEWHHEIVTKMSELLYQDGLPKMIIASIINLDRNKDLTISNTAEFKTSGGALNFYNFIKEELMGELKKKYHVSNHSTLLGHSAGGLFNVFSLTQNNNPFEAFIAVTPTIRWDNYKLLSDFNTSLLESLSKQDKSFYLSIGNETGIERLGVTKLDSILSKTNFLNFDYKYKEYPEESHVTVPWKAYFDGLKHTFKSFHIPDSYSNKEFKFTINYFDTLGEKFDYDKRVPQRIILNRGYKELKSKNQKTAIEIFNYFKKEYPKIPIPYSILGDIYLDQKKYVLAQKHFESAYKIYPTPYVKNKLNSLLKLINKD